MSENINEFGVVDIVATVSIIVGIILIGKEEQTLFKKEIHLEEDKKKHKLGALALFFPIIYTLIDVFSLAEPLLFFVVTSKTPLAARAP